MSLSFSVCIPRIFANVSNKKIINTFEGLNLGKIADMNIVWKTGRDGSAYKMAFIHFNEWNNKCQAAINLRNKIENPNIEAKLVYDDPWYWILLPNKSPPTQVQRSSLSSKMFNNNILTNCVERIYNLEQELHDVYEELYQREYIPEKYRVMEIDEDWDFETGIDANGSIYSTSTITDVMPYYDNKFVENLKSTYPDDGPLHRPASSQSNMSDLSDANSSVSLKRWMTANYCGNE